MRDAEAVDDLAGAIADNDSIDWSAVRSGASTGSDPTLIDRLETIGRVAAAYRTPSFRSRPAERQPGATWGSLRIVAKIGEGAFGHVYRAWDARLDREVALKLVDDVPQPAVTPDAVEEGRLLARLRHPNVVTVFGADRIDGSVGIWMEFVKGATLEQELAERGPFDARDVAAIGLDLCQALIAVHDAGLLHHDIKAQNVIREPGGRVVLMDFGTGREPARSAPEDGGVAAGTPLYSAPELFTGAPCSVATEIYSVGVLLFHLATGAYPVTGHTIAEIREAHGWRAGSGALDAGGRLPRRLSRVLARALAVDPEDRYRDVRQLAWALEAVARHSQRLRRAAGWLGLGVVVMVASALAMTSVSSKAVAPAPLRRFILPVDADTVRGMTLSADGNRLAYIARVNGVDELVVRSLDEFTGAAIYSSSGLTQPFFSPDGRWVGVSDGAHDLGARALIKVPVDGGPATRLCEPGAPGGARWLPDGTIVFATRGELWTVPEAGGTPVRLLSSKLETGESLVEPDVLGDGTLLATHRRRGQPNRLVRVSRAGAMTPLEDGATNGRYSPSGHILFVRKQAVMARPVDARGAFTGPAVPVAEAGFAGDFEISGMGALIYRTLPRVAQTGLGAVWASRDQTVTTRVPFPIDDYRGFAWRLSPDDSKVFMALPHPRDIPVLGKLHSTIWIGDLRTGVLSQLTSGDAIPVAWAFDSRSVTIKTANGGLERRHIDGSGTADVLVPPPQYVAFGNRGTWSPDGRALVLHSPSGAAGTGTDLRAVLFTSTDAIGQEAPTVSPFATSRFNEFSPAFSPDGRWVAYQSDESGRDEIYVRPFPGPGPQIQISRDGGSMPKWQGHEIFYVQPDDSGKLIMAAAVESQPALRVTGTKVALRSVNFATFDVASDGRRFLLLVGTPSLPTQLNLILNWPTQLGVRRRD